MNAWKDSRKEMGSKVVNYSLQNILNLFCKFVLIWKPIQLQIGEENWILLFCRLCDESKDNSLSLSSSSDYCKLCSGVPANSDRNGAPSVNDGDWLLCQTCLCDWYSLLQCVAVLNLILTLKLIFRQSKQSQGLTTLLFFDYFKGLVMWKDKAQ